MFQDKKIGGFVIFYLESLQMKLWTIVQLVRQIAMITGLQRLHHFIRGLMCCLFIAFTVLALFPEHKEEIKDRRRDPHGFRSPFLASLLFFSYCY